MERRRPVFFDPDNGIEVKNKPVGRKGSSKYVYMDELKAAYNARPSLLVYKHFPRFEVREPYMTKIAAEFAVLGCHAFRR